MATVDTVTASQSIPLQADGVAQLDVEWQVSLPQERRLTLQLVPQLGFDRRTRVTLDTGRGMMLENFLLEDVLVMAQGVTEGRCAGRAPTRSTADCRAAV